MSEPIRWFTNNEELIKLRQDNDLLRFAKQCRQAKRDEEEEIEHLKRENARLRQDLSLPEEKP